ncbi:MAG TPA: serine/threonine-protein kinase [Thermoanaerobaculia bacterium]|nr:serine/threonine-protein kinase [Thermoanaerobaculia bacterium]
MSQRIAKYEVLEKIAEGGFGTVYKARDPFIKRLVAIKTCSVADEEMARRFFREAEIAGRFDHPNVTIVHDFGVEEQTAYLVQEYLSGEDLLQKIRRREPLPLRQKVDWLLQVANGLAYAHAQQVIHRDIKPANLRVLENGQVKILDFGIAKLANATTQLTQKGMAVGTLGYLSPEQLRDQELDTRTDIFSYGVVAYELIAYARPFQGKQLSAVMDEILNRVPPPLREHVPECPASLERVVARCLEKDRSERYQSFLDVAADLEEVRRELTASRPVPVAAQVGAAEAAAPAATEAASGRSRASAEAPAGDGGPITRPIPLPPASAPAPTPRRADVEAPTSILASPRPAAPAIPPPFVPPPPPPPPTAITETVAAGEPPAPASALPDLPESIFAPPEPPRVAPPASPAPASAQTAPPRPAPRIPWGWLIVGAIVVLALAIFAGAWLFLGRGKTTAAPSPVATTAAQPTVPVVPTAATVVVLGTPWGELQSLKNAEGRELPLPARRETPLLLTLPAGHYVATLRHPAAPAPATCEVDAVVGQAATCRAALLPLEPLQYFKEAGWWR